VIHLIHHHLLFLSLPPPSSTSSVSSLLSPPPSSSSKPPSQKNHSLHFNSLFSSLMFIFSPLLALTPISSPVLFSPKRTSPPIGFSLLPSFSPISLLYYIPLI
jgi:hypothetical protein